MIDRQKLLSDLKPLLKTVEADLRARCDEVPQIDADLKKEYEQARAADRTGVTYEEWRADLITQVAVAWVLSCVFVRFLEDNALIAPPRISGPLHGAGTDAGLMRARDERETYFKTHPKQTDRDYLLAVFDDLAKSAGTKDVFGSHNVALAYRSWLSGDAAQKLIEFFQKIDADGTGEIIHDFTDPNWDTRFLGDLYQDLSEAARKKYALLQTPIFVEEFILDRTLEPAINEFGLKDFKMIDPACGSGHFLLGGFAHILKHWRAKEPGTNERELVNRALAAVHGVDLNPYAIAIARFRLLVVVMRECNIAKLKDAPAFVFNLVCGDSLLHGKAMQQSVMSFHELAHAYQSEDLPELQRILAPGTYHAVVANPPYITVKDKALNQAYRERYPQVCHMKYSLSVPFLQRLFHLAVEGSGVRVQGSGGTTEPSSLNPEPRTLNPSSGGFTGQITANSFMKREFGKKLIESYLPRIDLTHVIDTSGAYIPGHGTPTVILFGRNRKPVAPKIRAVMGIKGEPATPADPVHGLVWTAITQQIDRAGSQSAYVSVNDTPRVQFGKHPWSIGGGGAAELKELLDDGAESVLTKVVSLVGVLGMTNADDVMINPSASLQRQRVELDTFRPLVLGDEVRDWQETENDVVVFPYDDRSLIPIDARPSLHRFLWPSRTVMGKRVTFSKQTYFEEGRPWWEWHQVVLDRLRTPLSIVFGEVATHNHFVLDRGGKVFKQTAPVIKLPATATEDDHLGLLGILNSSLVCFWLKQVVNCKGLGGQGGGIKPEAEYRAFNFNASNVEEVPLPAARPLALAKQLDALAQHLSTLLPAAVVREAVPTAALLAERRGAFDDTLARMIALQEELDWQCYRLYGLIEASDSGLECSGGSKEYSSDSKEYSAASKEYSSDSKEYSAGSKECSSDSKEYSAGSKECSFDPKEHSADSKESSATTPGRTITSDHDGILPPIALGQRAFELVLARKMVAGEEESTWFSRHRSTPITQIPKEWPADYRALVQKRIDLIESDANIALIERPEYKRRWNTEPWDEQQERALKGWLLDRLEGYFDVDGRMNDRKEVTAKGELHQPRLTSVAKIADVARADKDFMQVAEIYAGRMDFDVGTLVAELMTAESVPALPILRYKPAAMDKRTAWERTWDLQREEDRINAEIERLTKEWKQAETEGKQSSEVQSKIKGLKSALPKIPVPPKYTSADFQNSNHWRLRGKLDVPKERWVSFPHCEGEDGTLVIAWAGYDHLQLARAIAERYELAKENEGRKLVPLLAAIGGLIPWLKQWHNELDPKYGARMGDYFAGYLAEEAKALGMSVEQVMAWVPPEKPKGRTRRKKQ